MRTRRRAGHVRKYREGRFSGVNDEIEKLKAQIDDYERQLILLRRHNDEQDTTIKSNEAKIKALENELVTRNNEIDKLNELNARLQREKQEVLK